MPEGGWPGPGTELSRIGSRSSQLTAIAWALIGVAVVALAVAGRVPKSAPTPPGSTQAAHSSAEEAAPRRSIPIATDAPLPSLDGRVHVAPGLTVRSPQPGSVILGDGLLRVDLMTDGPSLGRVHVKLRSGPGLLARKELEPLSHIRAVAWLRVPLVREARAVELTLDDEATGRTLAEMELLQVEEPPVVITSPVLPEEHRSGGPLRVQGRARDGGDVSVRVERADGSAIASAIVPSMFDGTRYPYTSVFWVSIELPPEALDRRVWIRAEPSPRRSISTGLRMPVIFEDDARVP
ncbi:MAG: hypothetical protein ACR2JZ_03765 [Candidatus Limnocylindrales bacterium]